MVTMKDLDKVFMDFEGKALKDQNGTDLTVRKMLVKELGSYNGPKIPGDELIRAYDLGLKIHNSEKDVDLELDDDQIKFITKVVTETPMYVAVAVGQLFKYLDEVKIEAQAKDKAANAAKETPKKTPEL